MSAGCKINKISRRAGIAGQVQYDADVEYPGEGTSTVSFVGSTYGGPVVMITQSGAQTFVTDPDRFGTFGENWVRRFFGADNGSATVWLVALFPLLVMIVWFIAATAGMIAGATR